MLVDSNTNQFLFLRNGDNMKPKNTITELAAGSSQSISPMAFDKKSRKIAEEKLDIDLKIVYNYIKEINKI